MHIHEYLHHIHTACILYGRKLSREKTFANFAVLWPFMKVFSVKFGNMASFGAAQASNLRKFSPQKLYFLPICESFLPQKFSAIRYLTEVLHYYSTLSVVTQSQYAMEYVQFQPWTATSKYLKQRSFLPL